jgi:hypothetical protein
MRQTEKTTEIHEDRGKKETDFGKMKGGGQKETEIKNRFL